MVQTTAPKLDDRPQQHTAGIRTLANIDQLSTVIPQLTDEVFNWLEKQGIAPAGPSFVRYHVINMAENLDIELGFIVAEPVTGDGRVVAGTFPAGRYASLVYTDIHKGMAGNAVLIGWAEKEGIKWDRWDDPNGDAFRSRYELLINEPSPDMSTWETEVAIKLADGQ